METCEKCSQTYASKRGLSIHRKFCDGTIPKPKWTCHKCNHYVHSQRERHVEICDGLGPGAHKRSARNGRGHDWNKGLKISEETKEKIACALRGKPWKTKDPDTEINRRKKISEKMKNNPNAGGYREGSGVGKGGWYDSEIAGRVYLDSSFEKRVAQCFDKHQLRWERNKEKFPYEYNGKSHYYTPDFVVNGMFVEVKGWISDKDLAKWKHFPFNLNILTEVEIIEMESGRLPKWS
jgi:hypothetical protein